MTDNGIVARIIYLTLFLNMKIISIMIETIFFDK